MTRRVHKALREGSLASVLVAGAAVGVCDVTRAGALELQTFFGSCRYEATSARLDDDQRADRDDFLASAIRFFRDAPSGPREAALAGARPWDVVHATALFAVDDPRWRLPQPWSEATGGEGRASVRPSAQFLIRVPEDSALRAVAAVAYARTIHRLERLPDDGHRDHFDLEEPIDRPRIAALARRDGVDMVVAAEPAGAGPCVGPSAELAAAAAALQRALVDQDAGKD